MRLELNRDDIIGESGEFREIGEMKKSDYEDFYRREEPKWIFPVFRENLNKKKLMIGKFDKTNDWDKMKKLSNPYELIHISNCKKYNNSIAERIPVSRSYFKMKELLKEFGWLKNKEGIRLLSIAEGPGGFIEALNEWRGEYRSSEYNDLFLGYTLYPKDKLIPGWNKLKRKKIPNTILKYGDIYNPETVEEITKSIGPNMAGIVSSDGGFDFSQDYTYQEVKSYHILFSELLIILKCVKKGGIGIIKMFDIFSLFSIQLILIMSVCFEKTYLIKLKTSRTANSEKYLIGEGFKECEFIEQLEKLHKEWFKNPDEIFEFNLNIPKKFLMKIYDYNSRFLNYQIKHIDKTFELINNKLNKKKYEEILKQQTILAYNWCIKHKEPINILSRYYIKYKEDLV